MTTGKMTQPHQTERNFSRQEADVLTIRWLNLTAGLLIVLTLAATAAILFNLRQRALTEATRELRTLSLVLADQIERDFQSIELVQQAVVDDLRRKDFTSSREFAERSSTRDTHLDLAARIAAPQPHFSALTIRDAAGQIVNSSLGWPVKQDVLDPNPADRFRSEPADRFIGSPSTGPASGSSGIYLARRIDTASETVLGMVLGTMPTDYFDKYFEKVSPGPGSSIALFLSDGTLVARHPRKEAAIGARYSPSELGNGALAADPIEFRQRSPIDGEDKIVAARKLSHYPVSIIMTTSERAALSEWYKMAAFAVAALAAVISAILVVAVICRRHVRGNLKRRSVQFAAALDNISHGLVMFDSRARLVVCNSRYAALFGLPSRLVTAGTPLTAILEFRKMNGTFDGDPAEYAARRLARNGSASDSHVAETRAGRSILTASKAMEGGGWVATHEDITDRVKREASFRLLFESNPVPMWVYDLDTLAFIAVNEAAVAKYGYTRDQFAGMTVTEIRPPEDRERFVHFVADIAHADGSLTWRHRTSDGSLLDVCIFSQALTYEGREARLVAVHDVTAQKRSAEQLARTKKFLDAVIENVPMPIMVKEVPANASTAEDCRVTLVNKAAEDMFGLGRSECIGRTVVELFPEVDMSHAVAKDQQALESEETVIVGDYATGTREGEVRIVTSRRVAIRDAEGHPEHLICLFEDVTDRRAAEQRIAYMALHDSLTGLANRSSFDRCFEATLHKAEANGSGVRLLCMDLDGFKKINDTYGHSAGDEVLKEVAARLQRCGEDAFIARFGGDEFAMIVAGDGARSGDTLTACLLDSFRTPMVIGKRELQVGITVGVAEYPAHGSDCETLLSNADLALYRAKSTQPGTVQTFNADIGRQVRERAALQEDLRKALDTDELTLHYQPQVNAAGETIGFEALSRWTCPQRGSVPPAIFIAVAEETDLIVRMGEHVLYEACRQAASWAKPLKIAVNVSPKQFRQGDLAATVHRILLQTGLAPHRLELEMTEGILIDDFSRAVSVLNRLKALGVEIALDDFGTGYSSLSYLHSFPFDLIKIDRAFISDLHTNRHSMAIVQAVIGLANTLGVPVLAEGVETEEQRRFLFAAGCRAVQGYLTGRPQPVPQFDGYAGPSRQLSTGTAGSAAAPRRAIS